MTKGIFFMGKVYFDQNHSFWKGKGGRVGAYKKGIVLISKKKKKIRRKMMIQLCFQNILSKMVIAIYFIP